MTTPLTMNSGMSDDSSTNRSAVMQKMVHGETATQPSEVINKPKDPSNLKQLWVKTGLDLMTVLTMMKAAVPPTIATAIYQAPAVNEIYGTLGFLVAIVSILGMCIMPRAKFIHAMIINLSAICLGASVNLLAIWTSVQARRNTTPAGVPAAGYNSSSSTVCAIWLFFQIYAINVFRAAYPQLTLSAIIYSIFAIVAMTSAPQFPTMSAGVSFATKLLEAFLTGFGIAAGVSLFIFPMTMRKVVFKEMTGYLGAMRGALMAQTAYMTSLETQDMFRPLGPDEDQLKDTKDHPGHKWVSRIKSKHPRSTMSPKATKLKAAVGALLAVHNKLRGDIDFGKREIAYGKIGPCDLSEIARLLRQMMLPIMGLSSIINIFERFAEVQGWKTDGGPLFEGETRTAVSEENAVIEWQTIMRTLHEPFAELTQAMGEGIEHVSITLGFRKPVKNSKIQRVGKPDSDVEDKGDSIRPGDADFASYYDDRINKFYEKRKVTLREWCEQKHIKLPSGSFETSFQWSWSDGTDGPKHGRDQRQLFVILYMEYLLWSASRALLHLIQFADTKVADGTMAKNRIITPGTKRIRKWVLSTFQTNHASSGDQGMGTTGSAQEVYLGDAYQSRKDPEHLPPETFGQRMGDHIRMIPRMLRSPNSIFGFRVACATMSIAIVAYLEATQQFFVTQRLLWAIIMIAFSMQKTAGQSAFQYVLRTFGTFVAMVASYVIWYIVDGSTPGVIVFLFIWIATAFYVPIKHPQFAVAGIISAVTVVLIIGYELQVAAIGTTIATSTGQPYYPLYLLAPYRLACVSGGILVAFLWTIFPYPISEHSELRKDLGGALYLLANFYSVVHETVKARIRGDEGDMDSKTSPGRRLQKARMEVFTKASQLIASMKMSSSFTRWQISMGGRFPKETYDHIIVLVENILNDSALIGYASTTLGKERESGGESPWINDFSKLVGMVSTTSHDITSLLSLLSSSISNGQPLPPYLKTPDPFALTKKLEALDGDILSIRHIAEPGYAAFAVMQIASRSITADLAKLTEEVKKLVGELDFSFHAVSTASSSNASDTTLNQGNNNKGKKE